MECMGPPIEVRISREVLVKLGAPEARTYLEGLIATACDPQTTYTALTSAMPELMRLICLFPDEKYFMDIRTIGDNVKRFKDTQLPKYFFNNLDFLKTSNAAKKNPETLKILTDYLRGEIKKPTDFHWGQQSTKTLKTIEASIKKNNPELLEKAATDGAK